MIPTLTDLASDRMTHRVGDLFNPPALTNFLGCVGVGVDVSAITHITFPPFSSAETLTAALRVNGRHFQSLGVPVTFQWLPDRIERTAEFDGLRFRSTTVMPMDSNAVVVEVQVENTSGASRDVSIGWSFQGGITRSLTNWESAVPPCERDNRAATDPSSGRIAFTARHSNAVAIQGVFPVPDWLNASTATFDLQLAAGASRRFILFWVADETESVARSCYDRLVRRRDSILSETSQAWTRELEAMFTPGNDRYSGHLPDLSIEDPEIQKLYWLGALGLAYFRRDSAHSKVGRTYDTLMPRYWPTAMVLWDYSLSGMSHAMLDPAVMRRTLELWMRTDVHTHFGTCYLTGEPIGPWYAVNDYAMASMICQYVRWSGDLRWLEHEVTAGKRVVDYQVEFATSWKQFEQPSGLAGYGGLYNLLECVSSYVHEVASLNAANVSMMRATAELLGCVGRDREATELRGQANALFGRLQQLYVPELGCWMVRNREQQLVTVRHAYDLLTVLNCVPDDLSESQQREMAGFFVRELQTPTWMRSLSAEDDNVIFSLRPDHQWNGAYPAWPPETAKGLCQIGRSSLAYEWFRGLARSANQGPFGQAHFVQSAVPGESGGARKASAEAPYINDWHSSSSGSWLSAIIEGILGLRTMVAGEITARFCDEATRAKQRCPTFLFRENCIERISMECDCSDRRHFIPYTRLLVHAVCLRARTAVRGGSTNSTFCWPDSVHE